MNGAIANHERALEKFEKDLARKGHGRAPNGADYKLVEWTGKPAVERVFHGDRETIVGFNGVPFDTYSQARAWAISDGRRVIAPGKEIHLRELLA